MKVVEDIVIARGQPNCYELRMIKKSAKSDRGSVERTILIFLLIAFGGVMAGGWAYTIQLRNTVAANNAVSSVDPGAVVAVEQMRNLAESQIGDSRSFFLLGSKTFFDKQKEEKQALLDAFASFEKKYSLPKVPEILQRMRALVQQHQDIFDQGMEFREKQTESKIVGQFYQSKIGLIRKQLNESLDEIVSLHREEFARASAEAQKAAKGVEVQIPKSMALFTGLITVLFLSLAVLVVRMLRVQRRHIADRDRLFVEAKNAVLARDEMISAVSQDLNEPLQSILQITKELKNNPGPEQVADSAELIQSIVVEAEGAVRDIYDQKNADLGHLRLRLEQLGINEILDEAQVMLQPLAKQRDVRLQFVAANPPVLAFCDRERIMRVFLNLVGNSIKLSPKHSQVVIKVRSDSQFAAVSITDQGPSISEKNRAKLFDQFWQARKTADQGAGVGLAVVKTIVEAHGGTVTVESTGHGNTFTFTLPRRRPVGAQIKKAPPARVIVRSSLPQESQP